MNSITGRIVEVRKECEQFRWGEVILFLGPAHLPEIGPLHPKGARLWCKKCGDTRKYTVHKSQEQGEQGQWMTWKRGI